MSIAGPIVIMVLIAVILVILGVRMLLIAVNSDVSDTDLKRAAGTASRKRAIWLAAVTILVGIGIIVWLSICTPGPVP